MNPAVGAATAGPSPFRIALLSIRPRIMPASISPVLVGTAVAIHHGEFVWWVLLCSLMTAMALQIASNLANDALDGKKGTDTEDRLGPMRVTASGLATYQNVMKGAIIALVVAMIFGIPLLVRGGWPFVLLGIAAMISAIAYTGGPFPIGYKGLGEVFVMVFFGFAAVTGTAFLHTQELFPLAWWAAVPPGALIVAILVVNNYRDREGDAVAGKRTVAVRIGEKNTRLEFLAMLALAMLVPFGLWAFGILNAWVLLTMLSWPLFYKMYRQIHTFTGKQLNQTLGVISMTTLTHSLLFCAAILLA